MPDDILPFDKTTEPGLSRRSFGFALGAGVAVTASAVAADKPVVETDVMIKVTDGDCDAALFHPSGSGSWAGAVIFTDALGLRPAFRDMGRQLAAEGYTVLVPNPFYRTRKAPVLSGPFDFSKPEDRAKLTELTAPLTNEVKTRDGAAYISHRSQIPPNTAAFLTNGTTTPKTQGDGDRVAGLPGCVSNYVRGTEREFRQLLEGVRGLGLAA